MQPPRSRPKFKVNPQATRAMAGKVSKRIAVNTERQAALNLINGVIIDQKQLSELTQGESFLALQPNERARAQRLALNTLRHAGRADRALRSHLDKRPPEGVQNILRLGVVEIVGLGAPAHGVVNDLVTIAAANPHTRGMKGLINAVLRKAVADVDGKWDKSPVQMLPKWLRNPLMAAYGNGPMMQIETAHMRGAPVDLTVKSDAEEWAVKLDGQVLPSGSVRLKDAGQISALDGYDTGDWWVQDAAAAWPALWAGAQAGENVLDLCAAPGGKTMQLAASGATVTAVDISPVRMERVTQNLERTGLAATAKVADVLTWKGGAYDVVLLDAPCSATGTIRRHPDLPFAKDGAGISELIDLQAKMLNAAAKLVKPGGRLVFCTCSLIPDEGEVQAEEFLKTHKDFTPDPTLPTGIDPTWQTEEGGVRLRPDYWADLGGMDGFYIIRLNRAA